MRYALHYDALIRRAQARGGMADVYMERHHIVPRALGGGNQKSNLVSLTAREHFVAHLLLARIYGGSMWHAVNLMASVAGMSSRMRAIARREHAARLSERFKGKRFEPHDKVAAAAARAAADARPEVRKARSEIGRRLMNDPTHRLAILAGQASVRGRENNAKAQRARFDTVDKLARAPRAAPVRCIDTGIEYPSVRLAAEAAGSAAWRANLSSHLNGARDHFRGMKWEFVRG